MTDELEIVTLHASGDTTFSDSFTQCFILVAVDTELHGRELCLAVFPQLVDALESIKTLPPQVMPRVRLKEVPVVTRALTSDEVLQL